MKTGATAKKRNIDAETYNGETPLPLDKHERVAQLIAHGVQDWKAYGAVYGGIDPKDPAVKDHPKRTGFQVQASKLMHNNFLPGPNPFATRLRYLRDRIYSAMIGTRGELVGRLHDSVRTPISEIDDTHPLAQEKTVMERTLPDGSVVSKVTIKAMSKAGSADLIAKIERWTMSSDRETDATPPNQSEVIGNALDKLLGL